MSDVLMCMCKFMYACVYICIIYLYVFDGILSVQAAARPWQLIHLHVSSIYPYIALPLPTLSILSFIFQGANHNTCPCYFITSGPQPLTYTHTHTDITFPIKSLISLSKVAKY